MTPADLQSLLSSFRHRKVLLIGDEITDRNIYCTVRGANPPTVEAAIKWVEEHQ